MNRGIAYRSCLPILFALAACGAAPLKPTDSPVSAVEITEDGEELTIPPSGVTEIDENSSIRLTVNKAAAQRELAAVALVDDQKVKLLQERTTKLSKGIATLRDALAALEDVNKHPPKTPAEVKEAQHVIGGLEGAALASLQAVLTDDEVIALLGKGRNTYSVAIQLFSEQNDQVVRELNAMTAELSSVAWRMQAMLYTKAGGQSLHLAGYDDLQAGDPNIINKLAVPTNLLDVLNRTTTQAGDLTNAQDALRKVRGVAAARLEALRGRLQGVADELKQLAPLVAKIKNAPWASLDQGKIVKATVDEVATLVKTIGNSCEGGFQQLHTLSPNRLQELAGAAINPDSPIRKCLQVLSENAPKIAEKVNGFPDKLRSLRAAIQADAVLAPKVGQQGLQDLEELGRSVSLDATKELSTWWQENLALIGGDAVIGSDPVFGSTEHLKDRAYQDVADTSVDLVRSTRAPGDVVYFRAATVKRGAESKQWNSAPMRVVVSGWHVDVSGSVVFVRALKTQDQDSAFPAAPAATATLHYTSKRATNANHSSGLWNFINPGVGLHLAYLDLGPEVDQASTSSPADPFSEIGAGAVVQLFGDVIQGGVAYDLQVQRAYLFFGIGLQTATNFGLTKPAGGG